MQATVQERAYSPEEIFKAFLYELSSNGIMEIRRYDEGISFNRNLHLAFLNAAQMFPELMRDFSFKTIRGDTYGVTIDVVLYFLTQERVVKTLDGRTVITDQKLLPIPDERLRNVARYICRELLS